MHFRHIIISGLMVGAALLLPNSAFAEKNELSGQTHVQKTSVQAVSVEAVKEAKQTNVHGKGENTQTQNKTVVVPKPTNKIQVEKVTKKAPVKSVVSKATGVLKDFPEKAKSKMQAVQNKTETSFKAPGLEKVTAGLKIANGHVVKKSVPKMMAGKTAKTSLQQTEDLVKTHPSVKKEKAIEKDSNLLKFSKARSPEHFVANPPKKERPVPKRPVEHPIANQVLNPTPQTNSSGGKSNERVNHGLSSTSMADKWMEWNKFYENTHILPYLSRNAMMSNQWMNAPPSPPPQLAPILISVTRP